MSAAAIIVPLVVEAVCGAAGGVAVDWRRRDLGRGGAVLVGAVGGLAATWLAARIPGVARFVGGVEQATDAAMQSLGGLTPELLVGVGIAGLLGGVILTLVVKLFRARR